jgi:hypothetical protein
MLHGIRIEAEETETLNIALERGTAVYIQVTGGELPEEGLSIEFTDPEGRNLYGLTSLLDVIDHLVGVKDGAGSGVYVGRFSPGEYHLKLHHPKSGTQHLPVQILPGVEERILSISF